jgi:hypothetical protein
MFFEHLKLLYNYKNNNTSVVIIKKMNLNEEIIELNSKMVIGSTFKEDNKN